MWYSRQVSFSVIQELKNKVDVDRALDMAVLLVALDTRLQLTPLSHFRTFQPSYRILPIASLPACGDRAGCACLLRQYPLWPSTTSAECHRAGSTRDARSIHSSIHCDELQTCQPSRPRPSNQGLRPRFHCRSMPTSLKRLRFTRYPTTRLA